MRVMTEGVGAALLQAALKTPPPRSKNGFEAKEAKEAKKGTGTTGRSKGPPPPLNLSPSHRFVAGEKQIFERMVRR